MYEALALRSKRPFRTSAVVLLLVVICLAPRAVVADSFKLNKSSRNDNAQDPASGRWLTGYYPSYQESLMPPSEIDYTALTHLIHWPVLPRPDGTLDLDTFGMTLEQSQTIVKGAHAAGIKVLLGIGGDTESGATKGFRTATAGARRAKFVRKIVNLMRSRNYDGVDINWEDLRAKDTANFTALFRQLRKALNRISPRPLLTMPPAVFLGDDVTPGLVAGIQQWLDQVNIQTYVMSGPYDGWVTWFNSPLHDGGFTFPSTGGPVPSIDMLVDSFVNAGVPRSKIAIGIQFDAAVWAGGSGTDTGGVTKPRQSWVTAPTVDFMRYADIVTNFTPAQGFQAFFDDAAEEPWLSYDDPANDANDRFVSYDDAEAIRQKALYLQSQNLQGAFIFEITGDYLPSNPPGEQHPLLSAAKTYIKDQIVNTP
jgi:chitinase